MSILTESPEERDARYRRINHHIDDWDAFMFGIEYAEAISNLEAQEELNHEIKTEIEKGEEAAA